MLSSLIYKTTKIDPQEPNIKNVKLEFWRPSIIDVVPPARPFKYFLFYFFKVTHIFRNTGYGAVLAYVDGKLVASLLVVPKYFMWPFMEKADVQITYVKTDPLFQGKNLASSMLYKAYQGVTHLNGNLWYVTNPENVVSQRLAIKLGFELIGEGIRSKTRLNLKGEEVMEVYKNYTKRFIDLIISITLLFLLFPLLLIITLLLMFQNQGSAFFFQERPGKNHQAFKIVKFKSMNDKKDDKGNLLPDVRRITPLGGFVRKYSLDELPQLINVLNGDMSLVGPRPLLFKYLPLYSAVQDRRHTVRPGITGWAQVNGRNAISWTKKFELDIHYVDNLSINLDLKILFKTFLKVIKSDGVNQSAERPMQPFTGKN
jgi:lipopolysaccharide/colanic/teichoic acid biosynthesis glycosyltransferase